MGSPLNRTVVLLSVVLLVVSTSRVDAVKLKSCGARLLENQALEWNATHNSTEPPPIISLSYEQCLVECGTGLGDVNWRAFSQSFSAWLLPWIALMFQIPFGAEEPLDDVLSFFITIGSPALAAYSLQITHLNTRWFSKAFLDIKFPNSKEIPKVISAFHHVPIKISSYPPALLPSLIVLPQNDRYWKLLLKGANKTRRWSIPLIMNFVWVIFAVLLTIVDSFYSPIAGDVGYAVVATWTFLLPLIVGWLHVGCEPEPNHLRECMEIASPTAWVATNWRDHPVPAESVGHQALAIEFEKADEVPSVRKDELKTIPIFNYSRAFIWSQNAEWVLALVKNADSNAEQKIPVGSLGDTGHSLWVEGDGGNIASDNRMGTDVQVTQYCTNTPYPLEPDTSGMSNLESSGNPSTAESLLPLHEPHLGARNPSRWATGIWKRVTLATVLALALQWGTVGAAVIIHYWKRPAGLGCRALSFLLYGVAGTTSLFLFLASSILVHMSRPQPGQLPWSKPPTLLNSWAIFCRLLGEIVAILSAMGILTVCVFQATGAFNTCFCASTTFDKGRNLVAFLTINEMEPGISTLWICGLVMAFSFAALFGFSIYLGTPPRR